MNVTVQWATPNTVAWRFGHNLTIESAREAVEAWAAQLRDDEVVYVDGLPLSRADVANLHAAMDEAAYQESYDIRLEKAHDRARDFDSNWSK